MADPGDSPPEEGRRIWRGRSRGFNPQDTRRSPPEPVPVLELGGLALQGASSSSSSRRSDSSRNSGDGNGNGGDERGSPPGQRGTPRRRRDDYVHSRSTAHSKTGTSGDSIRLVTNYFTLQRRPTEGRSWRLYKYDVAFKPDIDFKGKRKALVWKPEVQSRTGANIFDGKNMYVSRELGNENLNIPTTDREGTNYVIEFVLVEELNPTDPMYMTFYNLVLRKCQTMLEMTEIGRHYYNDKKSVHIAEQKLELWPGFITSIKQHETSCLLCVEVTHKVLRMENVFQVMNEIRQRFPEDYRAAISRELVGTIIMTEYNKKTYRVDEIDWDKHPTTTFQYKGKPTAIVDYMKEKYNIILHNLRQPLLVSNPKKRDQHRGITQPFNLVPELCRMTGLSDAMRSNFQLMKNLTTHLHMSPDKRLHSVSAFVQSIMGSEKIRSELLSWGLRFLADPVEVVGRVIPKQGINFTGQPPKTPETPDSKADWTMAFRSCAMLSTVALKRWVILVPDRDVGGLHEFTGTLNQVSRPLNFDISPPLEIIQIQNVRVQGYTRAIQNVVNQHKGNLEMIFVVLSTNQLETYAAVKRLTYLEYGISSQCFLAKNLRSRGIMSIATKVAIQMNAKLGGEPWSVTIPLSNMMVVGFDVYKASTDGRRGTAVGAIVASTSKNVSRYFSAVSFHSNNEELSVNLVADFQKCLIAYREVNGKLPERILFYRDGVGEGQLSYVWEQELTSLKTSIEGAYRAQEASLPLLTFIVVSKRINTRILSLKSSYGADNPPPGTVVDDVITLPERYDFFIVAQSARQGTVSPTSYNVLSDNSGLPPDKTQMLSYKLCHLYYNWSGTVAVPAPVQYAHKLAFITGVALGNCSSSRLSNLLYYL